MGGDISDGNRESPLHPPMILRTSTLLAVLLVSASFVETASARRLSNSEIRRYGFAGVYRGDVEGFIKVKDDDKFDTVLVSQTARESLPVRNRKVVTGPSRRNGFFLVRQSVTGNDRRITVRMRYSGRSYNPDYKEDMVGSGTKILKVRRINGPRPQFEMSLVDRLQERAVDGGGIHTTWNIKGRLFK